MNIEQVDWKLGYVPVPARGGVKRPVALSNVAQKAILRIVGEAGGQGQVVTGGRGKPLRPGVFRLDRLLDYLAEADPNTITLPEWNLFGLRAGAANALAADGAPHTEIDAALGRRGDNHGRKPLAPRSLRGDVDLALIGAERWSRILLPPAIAP